MPINYKHLFDQDGFTSESINSRFEAAMGTGTGVNAITPGDVSRGAFRHEHLPVTIHRANARKVRLNADAAFTASSTGGFTASEATITTAATNVGTSELVGSLVYPTELHYGMGQSTGTLLPDKIGAVVVLANVSVKAFDASPATSKPMEDLMAFFAFIRVVTDVGTDVDFTRSIRSVSPRVLISDTAVTFDGMNDVLTLQDVPIRTVIRPVDIGLGIPKIQEIQLRAYHWSPTNFQVIVTKWNLTAIPLHTDYLEMT